MQSQQHPHIHVQQVLMILATGAATQDTWPEFFPYPINEAERQIRETLASSAPLNPYIPGTEP